MRRQIDLDDAFANSNIELVAISADARWALVAGSQQAVLVDLRDASTRREYGEVSWGYGAASLDDGVGRPAFCAISPTNRHAIIANARHSGASGDEHHYLLDLERDDEVTKLVRPRVKGSCAAVAFAADGEHALSIGPFGLLAWSVRAPQKPTRVAHRRGSPASDRLLGSSAALLASDDRITAVIANRVLEYDPRTFALRSEWSPPAGLSLAPKLAARGAERVLVARDAREQTHVLSVDSSGACSTLATFAAHVDAIARDASAALLRGAEVYALRSLTDASIRETDAHASEWLLCASDDLSLIATTSANVIDDGMLDVRSFELRALTPRP